MAALARHGAAALAALALAPVAGVALIAKPAWRDHLGERLGFAGPPLPGAVWVHGASVGEILAATRLLDALRAHGRAVLASTTSATGRAVLARARPDVPRCYAPLDHPWCAAAALARVAPAALVLVETELWPPGSRRRRGAAFPSSSCRDASRSAACRATGVSRRCCAAPSGASAPSVRAARTTPSASPRSASPSVASR